ncbi:MAG: putative histidine kinase, hybrid [Steroidobacteraceae bacterium]|jgi:PAS domain S-box-containing protein|nr:putative histidine kinase, hybrid [Steroidobacteraceae bacterium]
MNLTGPQSSRRPWRALLSIRHARRSLSGKLMAVMLGTTAIALAAAGAALIFTDLRDSRTNWADDVRTEAGIVAFAVQPALSFDDHARAERNLSSLQARDSISAAALYTPEGELFARYVRPGHAEPPPRPPRNLELDRPYIDGERVLILRPVIQSGETLGTIYLRAEYDIGGRVRAHLNILGAVMIIGLLAALFASSWLQRVVSRPMESMAQVARQIVEKRDYSYRAEKTTDDEMGVVIDAFNRMLDEVQSHARALETSEKLYRAIGESINYGVWVTDADGRCIYASESFLKLIGLTMEQARHDGWGSVLHPDDVDETMAAWKECARTGNMWYREHRMLGMDGKYHAILAQGMPIRDETGKVHRWAGINLDISRLKNTERALLEADRRKDEFLATLAHELRNPLAPIRNAVRILDSDAADERQRKWGREVIARQVQRMSLLLDDLLDVSRITRGQLELKKDFVDLKSVVGVAVETARPLLDAKRHRLTVELPAESVKLEADPLRLSQVIGNLLTNAAKYTDAEGEISLTARLANTELVIAIRDNGIGLTRESMPGLFTMFSQVNSAIDRAEGGLGIGLALVKGLVALHGGRVEVRSEGLGRGSEFIVHLPHKVLAPKASIAADSSDGAANAPTLRRCRVLVTDDNRDAAESLSMVLRFTGYEVFTAFNGADALATGERERPHAAIIDIGMPGMSGHEVARRMRLEAWGRNAVLIALTGWGQDQDKQAAKAAGFDEHLTKPVDPDTVTRTLDDLLEQHKPGTGSVSDSARNA